MKKLKYVWLILTALLVMIPLVFTVLNAFMGSKEFFCYYGGMYTGEPVYMTFHLFPDEWSLEAFRRILIETPNYLMKFWNSVGITGAIVAGQILVSVFAGYGFSKFQFWGKNVLFVLVIILMMMPYQVTLVSNYIILDKMGLIGTYAAVILPGIFSPFGTFLMRQVIDGIPKEFVEAARLDGAGHFKVLREIIVPIAKGGIVSLLMLNFIDNWNMVEQPLVFLREAQKYPLSIFLAESVSGSRMEIFACGVLAMLPPVLLFANFQDELISGIELSGIK